MSMYHTKPLELPLPLDSHAGGGGFLMGKIKNKDSREKFLFCKKENLSIFIFFLFSFALFI